MRAYPCICTWEKWEMPSAIPALGRKTARESEVQRHPWLHSKFRANLGCVRLSQKRKQKKNNSNKRENKYRTRKSTRDGTFRKMCNLSLVSRKVISLCHFQQRHILQIQIDGGVRTTSSWWNFGLFFPVFITLQPTLSPTVLSTSLMLCHTHFFMSHTCFPHRLPIRRSPIWG